MEIVKGAMVAIGNNCSSRLTHNTWIRSGQVPILYGDLFPTKLGSNRAAALLPRERHTGR